MKFILACFLFVAVIEDVRFGKISNRLITISLFTGVIGNVFTSFSTELLIRFSLIAIAMFLLYMMKAFGAGDAKLFSVMSLFIDWQVWLYMFFGCLVIGAFAGLIKKTRGGGSFVKLGPAIFASYICVMIKDILF